MLLPKQRDPPETVAPGRTRVGTPNRRRLVSRVTRGRVRLLTFQTALRVRNIEIKATVSPLSGAARLPASSSPHSHSAGRARMLNYSAFVLGAARGQVPLPARAVLPSRSCAARLAQMRPAGTHTYRLVHVCDDGAAAQRACDAYAMTAQWHRARTVRRHGCCMVLPALVCVVRRRSERLPTPDTRHAGADAREPQAGSMQPPRTAWPA